ncbi:xylan glycosyltransferase MUCI21-like [Macadamia integrifolia]|uniref:xylan glycosyltransferase MUCI21-like n=1 Tax=Macadamia integrifolia TaxID=60698 RepID=UPI001C4FCF2A|nr:xylan glycosyltransferase MUCI21-like [Macadamia integrifolia]
MGQHHRYHQPRQVEEDGEDDREYSPTLVLDWGTNGFYKRTKRKLLPLLFLFSFVSCSLILVPQLFSYSETLSFLHSFQLGSDGPSADQKAEPLPSSTSDEALLCDRRAFRYDTCLMKGDIRILAASSSIINYLPYGDHNEQAPFFNEDVGLEEVEEEELHHEKIKPYTRKWETSVMNTIRDVELIVKKYHLTPRHECDVRHTVPAVIFSTGGYTGNVYHEFNDGLIPLYITTQHLKKKFVIVVADYHRWWYSKYGDILSHLTDYPPIDFYGDSRTHCFPEAIVGLKIHDELTVNASFMPGKESIRDFRNILDKAYWPRIKGIIEEEEGDRVASLSSSSPIPLEEEVQGPKKWKPVLVIISRNGSRSITNEAEMVKLAEEIGFQVEILKPDPTTELAKIYRVLNNSDAMIGVHGAAMTHLLFMRPGTVFIQVIPLGTDWAAYTYYGEPAIKLGLKYVGYKLLPKESSLYGEYDRNDPVLTDPDSVNAKGWQFTKKIYLDGQKVKLDLKRFRKRLARTYEHTIAQRTRMQRQNPQ